MSQKKNPNNIYSYNTAIKRRSLSAPVRYLRDKGLLSGYILDYGCGRGYDSGCLSDEGYKVDSFDPYWRPDGIMARSYDTIICNYVLNVFRAEDEEAVLSKINNLLSDDGAAYIAVRRDLKKEGETTRGFQRKVFLNLPVEFNKSGSFCIYKMAKTTF